MFLSSITERMPASLLPTTDPLDLVLAPPPDETEEQRRVRLGAEAEAKRVSDQIDEDIQRQEKAEKKGPKPVKVLLLGQSESGKSTTLKNFQLMNSPKAFRAERASWRAVIHLNVVRSIRIILEAMAEVHAAQIPFMSPPSSPGASNNRMLEDVDDVDEIQFTAEHLKLKMRLSPLVQVEQALIRKLTPPGSTEFEATHLANTTNLTHVRPKEVAINSQFAWKGLFGRLLSEARESFESQECVDWDDPQDPGRIIYACGEDMIRLWNDPVIKALLKAKNIRLEDKPGFFLDSLDRVTSPRYVPTDDDVLRARLKTLGVSEHNFTIKEGGLTGGTREWKIFDVGGHRSLVTAWAPFFDDMDAILFLAPISCFDEVLEEDSTVNRLEDSVILWKSIVSNQLLKNTTIVLFLNKVDIFKAKLAAGIRLGKYIVSYGNRPNDFENTSAYLQRKFAQIHRERSPEPRIFYCHHTTVTDTKSTQHVLIDVQNTAVVNNLKDSRLIT